MIWLAAAVAVLVGAGTAAATPWLLSRLPEPVDDPEIGRKIPYVQLATRPFVLAVFAATTAASLATTLLTAPASWLAWSSLATVGVLAAAVDLRTTYLPLRLAQAGWAMAAAGAVATAAAGGNAWPLLRAAGGALALGGFFWLFWRLVGGLGFGDVRLAATVGAVTSLHSTELVLAAAFCGTAMGAGWGLGRRVLAGRDTPFPYGPALTAGPFLALLLSAAFGR